MRTFAFAFALVVSVAGVTSAAAQEAQTENPKAQTARQAPETVAGQALNIRVDFTLTEQTGPGTPAVKTISLLVADNASGRVRSQHPGGMSQLNVDARPRVLPDGRVLLTFTLEYAPGVAEAGTTKTPPHLSESISVVLENGKPLVVSQSADPNTDRKVKLEAKATALR